MISPAIPKKKSPANKAMGEFNKLKLGMTITYIATAMMHIQREAYFVNNQPAIGNDTNEPIGNPIKTVPNCASERPKKDLKSGIRVAQVAKFKPQIKNKIPILKRAFFINSTVILPLPSNHLLA